MTRTPPWIGGLAAIAAGAALFSPTLNAPLVGDDYQELSRSLDGGLLGAQAVEHGRNFRPLVVLLHRLFFGAWGTQPLPHHLINLAIHVVAAAFVGMLADRLARRQGSGQARVAAWMSSAIFLVHPSHTEAVSWMAGRGALVMTVAALAALVVWLGPVGRIPTPPTSQPGRLLGAQVLYLVALLAYEPAISLPIVTATLAVAFHGRRGLPAVWPFVATSGFYLLLRTIALGRADAVDWRDELVGSSPLRTVLKLGIMLARSTTGGLDFGGVVGFGLIGATGVAFVAHARSNAAGSRIHDAVIASGAATAAASLPVAALGVSLWNTAGERLLYLPSGLASAGIGLAIAHLPRRVATALAAALVIGSAVMLVPAQLRWRDGAAVAGSLIDSMSRLPRDSPALVLAEPDLLRGAIVARNALGPDREVLAGWQPTAPIHAAATYDMGTRDATAHLEVRQGGRELVLRLEGDGTRFLDIEGPGADWDVPGIVTSRIDERSIKVTVPDPFILERADGGIEAASIWWFDGTTLRPVNP